MRSEGTTAHHSAVFRSAPDNRDPSSASGQIHRIRAYWATLPMPSSRIHSLFPVLGLLVLAACQSMPPKPDANVTTPGKPEAEASESKDGWFSKGALRWPWEKDDPREPTPSGMTAETPAEKASSAKAEPVPEEQASGWRWPWQKKPGAEEAEPGPAPEPTGVPPPPPSPGPEAIRPRVPEPGLAPTNVPAPRNEKERDPLSGVGLHPGS